LLVLDKVLFPLTYIQSAQQTVVCTRYSLKNIQLTFYNTGVAQGCNNCISKTAFISQLYKNLFSPLTVIQLRKLSNVVDVKVLMNI